RPHRPHPRRNRTRGRSHPHPLRQPNSETVPGRRHFSGPRTGRPLSPHMSSARHHAEWLSLVEVSGPFLSLPVLARVFPQGLDAHDPDMAKNVRLAREEWEADREDRHPDPAIHHAWVRFILRDVLEFPGEVLSEGQSLPPGL